MYIDVLGTAHKSSSGHARLSFLSELPEPISFLLDLNIITSTSFH
jgi:hypothetical protein